jgi:primase-polymerase (primpol)-like protein
MSKNIKRVSVGDYIIVVYDSEDNFSMMTERYQVMVIFKDMEANPYVVLKEIYNYRNIIEALVKFEKCIQEAKKKPAVFDFDKWQFSKRKLAIKQSALAKIMNQAYGVPDEILDEEPEESM